MTHGPSRRVTLRAAVGSALALPVIHSGTTAHASAVPLPPGSQEPPVTNPRESGAVYGSDAARGAHAEPLNAAVGCALGRGGRS